MKRSSVRVCSKCKREFTIVPGYSESETVCGVCLAKEKAK